MLIGVRNITAARKRHIEKLFSVHGSTLKAGTLREHGIHNRDLVELIDSGILRKARRGYYMWIDHALDTSDIETAASLIPFGIICLQSAAFLHQLSQTNPSLVNIAISSNRSRVSLPVHPPVQLFSYSLSTFTMGVTDAPFIEKPFRIYNRERTVCDFFRKRKQLGMDLVLEVLQNYMQHSRNLQLLIEYAETLHIRSVITPYLEALA